MNKNPKVTIGICCYNAEATISRAIASALKQEYEPLEIVVVDDASTDGSRERIDECLHGVARAKVVSHQNNQGPGAARNTLLANSTGDYITFFDDDDESSSQRVKVQVATLLNYERKADVPLVACFASGRRVYPSGYTMKLDAIGSRGDTVPQGASVVDYLLFYRLSSGCFYGFGTPTCALMMKRSALDSIGGFDPSLRRVEDADMAIRLALAGGHFIGTTERLFVQYASSGSDKTPEINLASEQALADKHQAYLRKIGRFYHAKYWPRLRYFHFKRKYLLFLVQAVLLFLNSPITTIAHFLATGPRRLVHERSIMAGRQL